MIKALLVGLGKGRRPSPGQMSPFLLVCKEGSLAENKEGIKHLLFKQETCFLFKVSSLFWLFPRGIMDS